MLAIIVVLAIIAVITVPIILNVIDSAKQGAARVSATGYIRAVDNQLMINGMDRDSTNDIRCDCSKTAEQLETVYGVSVNGEKPLNKSTVDFVAGEVVGYKLYINGYIVTKVNDVITVVKDDNSNVPVQSITGLDAITMTVGEEGTITASVLPTDATNKALTYTGYDTNIITISNGKITALAPGTEPTRIKVTSVSDSSISDYISVTVNSNTVALTGITFPTNSIELDVNETYALTPSFTPDNATNKSVTYSVSPSNTDIIEIVGGNVVGKTPGTATVIATSIENSDITAGLEVTVKTPTVSVTGVDITDNDFELIVGQTKQLQFNISPTGATNNSMTWQSNHPEYATVSNTGFVTAMGKGIATITVTTGDGNFTDTVTVNVKEKYITDISNDCAKAGHTECSDTDIYKGVSMNVKVNSTTTKAFHVIADDGNILTLQMDSNIATGSGSEWYIPPESSYSNLYGPVTALTKLHELTSDWTNVLPMKNYTYNEGNYMYGYQSAVWNTNGELTITGNASLDETKRTYIIGSVSTPMRARMITAQEVAKLAGQPDTWNSDGKGGSFSGIPDWMKLGISDSKPYGYWILGSYNPASDYYNAWYVYYAGYLTSRSTNITTGGVRPVINIPKSDVF